MYKSFTLAAMVVFAMLAATPLTANAEMIDLSDPSWEAGFSGTNGTPESGWFTFGGAVGGNDVSGGFWGDMANRDGSNAAYAVQLSETDGGSIYQTVELNAGTTYRFTAGVGTSTGAAKNDGKYALVFFDAGFGTLLAETSGVVLADLQSFSDFSVDFTPTVTANYQVGVRNRGYVPGTGADNDASTVFFDNARLVALTAPTAPEPTSLVIACLGLVGLTVCGRRRRR